MRDSGEFDRFQVYERMKIYSVTPPFGLKVNDKYLRHFTVLNCVSPIVTANKKQSFYLPADDRRNYVAWSTLTAEKFTKEFWDDFWVWYRNGGYGHVAAFLTALDISKFNPFKPPPKTAAFWEIVTNNMVPEDAELADAIQALGKADPNGNIILPNAITTHQVAQAVSANAGDFFDYLTNRKNNRVIHHRMAECGYVPIRYKHRDDGYWQIGPKRHVIYAKANLTVPEQYRAAEALVAEALADLARGTQRPSGVDSIWMMTGRQLQRDENTTRRRH
jgi:hypothetical protein